MNTGLMLQMKHKMRSDDWAKVGDGSSNRIASGAGDRRHESCRARSSPQPLVADVYASDLFRAREAGAVGLEDNPDELPDLIAEILARSVEVRRRQRLTYGYEGHDAVLSRVRGRVDLLKTDRRQLLSRGLVACRFDHMTVDTPRNRFVRAALESIAQVVTRHDLRHRCRALSAAMKTMGVGGTAPSRAEMSTNRYGRHDAVDRCMVDAAKLAFDLALPTETAGANVLPLPDRDIAWVRRLFERAVGGFYNVVLGTSGWHVRCGVTLGWDMQLPTGGISQIFPGMKTDIVLEHEATARRIVIDTKFNSILTAGWYREDSLRSGYVYQIYAYLRSQAGRGDPVADHASGLLLHPSIGNDVDEAVTIQGHRIRFATVDLAASYADIRAQLLNRATATKPWPSC